MLSFFLFAQEILSNNYKGFGQLEPFKVAWMFRDDLILTHAFGGTLMCVSCFLIPLTLMYILWRFKFGFWLKAVFTMYGILLTMYCTIFFMSVTLIWTISPTLIMVDGYLRTLTGLFSMFCWGVTIYSALNFTQVYEELIITKELMISERAKQGKMNDETFRKFTDVFSHIQGVITVPNSESLISIFDDSSIEHETLGENLENQDAKNKDDGGSGIKGV